VLHFCYGGGDSYGDVNNPVDDWNYLYQGFDNVCHNLGLHKQYLSLEKDSSTLLSSPFGHVYAQYLGNKASQPRSVLCLPPGMESSITRVLGACDTSSSCGSIIKCFEDIPNNLLLEAWGLAARDSIGKGLYKTPV